MESHKPFFPFLIAGTALWDYRGLGPDSFIFAWNPGHDDYVPKSVVYAAAAAALPELQAERKRTEQAHKLKRKAKRKAEKQTSQD